jgi:hypothetical protein
MTESEFEELPLTHIERMDVMDRQHDHDMELEEVKQRGLTERAELDRSRARWKSFSEVATFLITAVGVVTVLLVAGFWIYSATRPDLDHSRSEQQREEACYDRGGGWVGSNQVVGEDGICVMPGRQS